MNKKLYKLMNWPLIESVVYGEIDDPYSVLGASNQGTGTLYQAFFPGASECSIETTIGKNKTVTKMELADEIGFFAQIVSGKPSDYEYIVKYADETKTVKDAYAFTKFEISAKDKKAFKEGDMLDAYRILGAHPMSVNKTDGVRFAVWAPNAISVGIEGDFNNWVAKTHIMKRDAETGIFEIFIPDVSIGAKYRYRIKIKGGQTFTKNDPYAFAMDKELDCSVVASVDSYSFSDDEWLKKRSKADVIKAPMSICEVTPSKKLLCEDASGIAKEGFTHIELMPVMECDNELSKGFETKGFYSVDSDFGGNNALLAFVDNAHKNGLGVILDWTPFHFPGKDSGLAGFDGTNLYEHLDPRKGIHPFYGTRLFNYARPEVKEYLISNALYLIEKFHLDGLKLCGTSSMLYLDYGRQNGEWISNIYGGNENLDSIEFIKSLNSIIKKKHPDVIMIAEEESGYPKTTASIAEDGLGFDFKLNKGFIDDQLDYMSYDPYFRAHHHNALTFSMVYQYSEKFISALGHDEVCGDKGPVLDRMPGSDLDKAKNLRLLYAFLTTHPGKKLFFEDAFSSDNDKKLITDLNALYLNNKVMYELDDTKDGFEWINSIDSDRCVISFLRKGKVIEESLVVVANFANVLQEISIGTDLPGKYKEILNTDSKIYGGDGVVNSKAKAVSETGVDARSYSFEVKMAPLSLAVFKYTPFTEKEKYQIEKRKEAAIADTKAKEFESLSKSFEEEYEIARKEMEEAKARMKKAADNAKKAKENADKEFEKAKKALEEAK